MCDCKCKRTTTKLFSYSISELNQGAIYTHKSCVCNEIVALSQRHQVDDGSRYTSKLDLKQYLRPLIHPISSTSEDHIISRAVSSKKKLLKQAQETLAYLPLKESDGDIKMFLKDDKYHSTSRVAEFLGQTAEDSFGAPRCIQYRNKRYCLRLATYLHPIEEHCYAYRDWTNTPIFAKGRNMYNRGQDLRTKWESFAFPKALLLDHSKFDAHVSEHLLKLEHWFYTKCNSSPELAYLLRMQLINKGRTKNGTRYITRATRMSGDQNTGLGNSLINYAILQSFVDHYNLKASCYVDGDDSVIIIEDEGKSYDLSYFSQFGMVTKGDSTTNFSHVEFCQTRPVNLDQGWTMVRNPYRLLTRTPWTVKNIPQSKVLPYLASIGRCELALGMGAPIGQYIGQQLASLSNKHIETELEWVARQQNYRPRRAHLVPPSSEARSSYTDAWGISADLQMEIENCTIVLSAEVEHVEERPFSQ